MQLELLLLMPKTCNHCKPYYKYYCCSSAGTVASLGKAITGQVGNFDPRSLTDALWGFAKLGGKLDGGTISSLAKRVKELASKFKPQEAANALWALVKLDQANGGNAMKVHLLAQ